MFDYITIHDGYDTQYNILGRSTKQWSLKNWTKTIGLIKESWPELKIKQLGSKTSRPVDGVDENLINQTTITECFDILSKSLIHIDGDSGLVHAATRMKVPCIVIWGPTPHEFYGYEQNINLTPRLCGTCYGVKENWMKKCPVGYATPRCMDETLPDHVVTAVAKLLHSRRERYKIDSSNHRL